MDAIALKSRAITSRSTPASDALLDVRFRKTFEAAGIGIAICDLEGRIVEANLALERLLGYEPAELVGIDLWKEPRKLGGGESNCPKLADGESSDIPGIHDLLRREGELFVLERRCPRRDGSEFWGRLTASLGRDDFGQPVFLVVVLEDVSERKRTEEQLRQSEKMAAIGQLAGGVAHDFNNLLTGILLYCDLLIPELEMRGPLHRYVEEIRLATEQGAALTQQLLALARKEGLQAHAIDVNEVTSGLENLLRRLIGEQIELITELDPAAGTVLADAGQLRQILLNLVLNARDALGSGKGLGGKIRVSTRLTKWPQEIPGRKGQQSALSAKKGPAEPEPGHGTNGASARHRGDVNGRRPLAVLLAVSDNGCGMSAETCAHLFEPFFTTKAAGAGTGMGLGTVQRIVGELGGVVEIASAPDSGTRVEVFLPVAARQMGQTPRREFTSRAPGVGDFDTHILNPKFEENKGGSSC